ncbi:MAG: tetratricopeptide repeat protein [Alphaproteobacteria bacterium]
MRIVRVLAALACLTALAGCGSSGQFQFAGINWGQDTPPPPPGSGEMVSSPASASADITGSTPAPVAGADPVTVNDALLGGDPGDELVLGKRHYRAKNYGLAEQHFRSATEKAPRDGEAWLGLAASYDRLKRYDLADRAYAQALAIFGPRPEVINNIGYSYLLRGDLRRARQKFAEAQTRDPGNPTIANNIALVDEAVRRRKGLN